MLVTSSFYFHTIQSSNLPPTPLESCMSAGTHQFDGPNHLHPLNLYLDMSHIVYLIFKSFTVWTAKPCAAVQPPGSTAPREAKQPPKSQSSPFDIHAKGATPEPRGATPPPRGATLPHRVRQSHGRVSIVSFRSQLRVSVLKRKKKFLFSIRTEIA